MGSLRHVLRLVTSALLLFILPMPQGVSAQQHVVSPADLQQAVAQASHSRQENLVKVRGFFSSHQAREALKSANISYAQVDKAISTLDDQELARIAARTDRAQQDFVAGRLSDRDLLVILVAIAALILIIVAVR